MKAFSSSPRSAWRPILVTVAASMLLSLGCGGSSGAEVAPESDAAMVDDTSSQGDAAAGDTTELGGDASSDASADAGAVSDAPSDGASDGGDAASPGDTGVVPSDTGADTFNGPNSVLVYTNNVENMLFDWHDLVYYMKSQPRNPDIFLIQQAVDKARLDDMLAFMSKTLGEKYEGVIAQNAPTHQRFQGEVTPRPTSTTGVIWRASRFNLIRTEKWFPWGDNDGNGGHTCATRTNNSGYQTIRVELQDVLANKRVAAVSLRHWTWMDCSEKNMIEMVDGQAGGANAHGPMPDYALQIVGGDFNGPAFDAQHDYKCWYRVTNEALGGETCASHPNLGFTDPIYVKCAGDKACVESATGIDFIFGRKTGGKPARASGYDLVTYEDGDAADRAQNGSDGLSNRTGVDGFNDVNSNYSEHRARKALFYYE